MSSSRTVSNGIRHRNRSTRTCQRSSPCWGLVCRSNELDVRGDMGLQDTKMDQKLACSFATKDAVLYYMHVGFPFMQDLLAKCLSTISSCTQKRKTRNLGIELPTLSLFVILTQNPIYRADRYENLPSLIEFSSPLLTTMPFFFSVSRFRCTLFHHCLSSRAMRRPARSILQTLTPMLHYCRQEHLLVSEGT